MSLGRLTCRLQDHQLDSIRNEETGDGLQLTDQIGDGSEMTGAFGQQQDAE